MVIITVVVVISLCIQYKWITDIPSCPTSMLQIRSRPSYRDKHWIPKNLALLYWILIPTYPGVYTRTYFLTTNSLFYILLPRTCMPSYPQPRAPDICTLVGLQGCVLAEEVTPILHHFHVEDASIFLFRSILIHFHGKC